MEKTYRTLHSNPLSAILNLATQASIHRYSSSAACACHPFTSANQAALAPTGFNALSMSAQKPCRLLVSLACAPFVFFKLIQ
jgi:hypothetical protein